MTKFAVFKYDLSDNVGDNIQSLAVSQHVKQVDLLIDRDSLSSYSGPECTVVMNGWFSHRVDNWPPSPAIKPIFFGFHLTPQAANAYSKNVDYLKRHAPIGCRDPETARLVREWGVESYVSGCATMTFPRRTLVPSEPDALDLMVDVDKREFHRADRSRMVEVRHTIANVEPEAKQAYALGLLNYYRDKARRVVTARIHCAMPCAAMGIPVAYIGVQEYRTDVIGLIGIKYNAGRSYWKLRLADLEYSNASFDEVKAEVRRDLRAKLASAGIELRPE